MCAKIADDAAGQPLLGRRRRGAPAPGHDVERRILTGGAWVDYQQGWVGGAGALFDRLVSNVPWKSERRSMSYDRVVDVPRLVHFYDEAEPLPDAALSEMRDALSARYASELGEPLRTVGLCLCRDGRDSAAWHGDTIGRSTSSGPGSTRCRRPRVSSAHA